MLPEERILQLPYECQLLGLDDSTVEEYLIAAPDHMTAASRAAKHAGNRYGFAISLDTRRLVYVPHPGRLNTPQR